MFHAFILRLAKAHAVQLAREKFGVTRRVALDMIAALDDADILSRASATLGYPLEGNTAGAGDESFLQKVLDWIKANPQVIEAIVNAIIALLGSH